MHENLTQRRTRTTTRAKATINVSGKRPRRVLAEISENLAAKVTQRETRAATQTAARTKATVTTVEKSESDATADTLVAKIKTKPHKSLSLDGYKCGHCDKIFSAIEMRLEHECRAHLPQILLRAIEIHDNTNIPSEDQNIFMPATETSNSTRLHDERTQKSTVKSVDSTKKTINNKFN